MTKLESLQDIKETAIELAKTLSAEDVPGIAFSAAEEAMRQLVDRLYRENEDMMTSEQYEAARNDFEYFARLVNLAEAYYRDGDEGEQERGNDGIG